MKKRINHTRFPFLIPLLLLLAGIIGIISFRTYHLIQKNQAFRGEFHGAPVLAPPLSYGAPDVDVLGDQADPNKRIEVDLSNQKVYAYEGGTRVFDFTVSTGLWGRTPTGEFTIQRKVPSQVMSGGNRSIGTYYYLPNVPWVQFFGNSQVPWSRGFSFHGTYWHNNFGHPMSHGCVNMKTPEAQALYNWAPMGTRVIIYGNTPAG